MFTQNRMKILIAASAIILSPLGCVMDYDNPVEFQDTSKGTEDDPQNQTDGTDNDPQNGTDTVPECDPGWRIQGDTCVFPLAENQSWPTSIAIDDTHVYWTTWGSYDMWNNYLEDGGVYRVSKEGGEIETLASDLIMPSNILIDEDHVYWANTNINFGTTTDAVMRVPKTGGTPDILAANQPRISALKVIGQNVFFSVLKTAVVWTSPTETPMNIMKAPKDGSAPAEIFYETPCEISTFAADAKQEYLYWAEEYMMRLPLDKSTPAVVLVYAGDSGIYVGEMKADDEWLYYAALHSQGLVKFSITEPIGTVKWLAGVDNYSMGSSSFPYGDSVYWTTDNWTEGEMGRILRSPKIPGEAVVLVEGELHPTDVAADENAVYWSTGGDEIGGAADGTIMKLRQPESLSSL